MHHALLGRPIYRIVIFRALQLGDLLCAVPALRALRATLPRAEITLVGLPWAREFVTRFHKYLDHFIEFPGYPGLSEKLPEVEKIPDFILSLQDDSYDLAIQLHGCGTITNPLVYLFGAKRMAGYYRMGEYCPDLELFLPYPTDYPEVWRHIKLVEKLGALSMGDDLEFPISNEDKNGFTSLSEQYELQPGKFVCIHAGARATKRRWPIAGFSAVIQYLYEKNLTIVLTGSNEEAALVSELEKECKVPCINLAGKTPLGTLGVLLARARLLLCNDTGLSHLAVATRTPSVVLFLESDLVGWPPLNRQRHRVLSRISGITPVDVMTEIQDLLSKEPHLPEALSCAV